MAVTAATCSFPPDAILRQALEDDWQAMRVESITAAVSDEIDFACSLPDSFWKRIPCSCSCQPRVIRSDVIEGCLVAEG